MTAQVHATVDPSTVDAIADARDEPDWLRERRHAALAALDDLAMPSVIHTPGRTWTNLTDLDFESMVDPLAASEEKDQVGPDEVDVLSFAEALEARPELVREHFGRVVDPEENYLTALSTALFTTGTVVYVPDGVDAEDVTIRTGMTSRSLFNYTLVVAGESSSVSILERQRSAGDVEGPRYYSGIVEVAPGENAHVQYGALQLLDRSTYNYALKRARTAAYATVTFVDGNLGSRLTKTEVGTELVGDASETKIVGAFFGTDEQHFDLDSKVWHRGEHTTADLVMRGVVDDTARSVYEGVQDVGADAWNTNSYQRERTLMLSDDAEADASPKLIINNHDTEASHSATVGQVDEEDLFYMVSRGMDRRTARNQLVEGFFGPVLEEVAVEELREDLGAEIRRRLWG
ncbi:MAG: Fe-S cluster assembly protein SufD [Halobacteriales archaeon]